MGKRSSELGGADPLDISTDPVDAEFIPGSGAGDDMFASSGVVGSVEPANPDTFATQFGETGSIEDEDPDLIAQREEIERTRSEMSSTIDAIQEKLSPENLKNQAKDAVKGATVGKAQQMASDMTDTVQSAVSDVSGSVQSAVGDVSNSVQGAVSGVTDKTTNLGTSVVDVIRENPIPAALTGIGLGWLFMSMRNRTSGPSSGPRGTYDIDHGYNYGNRVSSYRSPYFEAETRDRYPAGAYGSRDSDSSSGIQGKVGDMAERAQSTASDMANRAQDTAQTAMSQAQDTAGQVASQVQGTATQLADQAQQTVGQLTNQAQSQAQRAGSELDRLMHERPLAVGLGALAVGLVAGLAIPETRREDQLLGDTRENLMGRAQQVVQQTAQKVGTVAEEAVGAAKESAQKAAQDQGLTSTGDQS